MISVRISLSVLSILVADLLWGCVDGLRLPGHDPLEEAVQFVQLVLPVRVAKVPA